MLDNYIDKCRINIDDLIRIIDFSNQVVGTNKNHYAKRNQTNLTKIRKDIIIGKIGEFGIYYILNQKGIKVDEPDLQIYSKEKKSFDADLSTAKGNMIHVKSQSIESAKTFGMSWSFQKEDPLVIKPNKNDFVTFCLVDENIVYLMSFVKGKSIKTLYKDPKLNKLKGIKSVIYYEDLKNGKNDSR